MLRAVLFEVPSVTWWSRMEWWTRSRWETDRGTLSSFHFGLKLDTVFTT